MEELMQARTDIVTDGKKYSYQEFRYYTEDNRPYISRNTYTCDRNGNNARLVSRVLSDVPSGYRLPILFSDGDFFLETAKKIVSEAVSQTSAVF